MAVSQSTNYAPVLIAPNEYAMPWQGDDGDNTGVMFGDGSGEIINYFYHIPLNTVSLATLSRYMFDDDDGLEIAFTTQTWQDTDFVETYVVGVSDNTSVPISYPGLLIGVMQTPAGAVMILEEDPDRGTKVMSLPGNTPQYDHEQANRQVPVGPGRVDTVYQLVTERIFTSDTVYLQETITLEGDVDTVFVNRTFTTRDTVYNETTITQVSIDSVFLVGGQYAKDVVLAVDKALNSETLQAYPNPASDAVTISSEASGNVELKIYDTLGKVMESVPLSGGPHDTVISVADYGSGVYLYMLIGENSRSSTKRFIVD